MTRLEALRIIVGIEPRPLSRSETLEAKLVEVCHALKRRLVSLFDAGPAPGQRGEISPLVWEQEIPEESFNGPENRDLNQGHHHYACDPFHYS